MNSAMPIGDRALGKSAATTMIVTRIGTVRMMSTKRISTLSTHRAEVAGDRADQRRRWQPATGTKITLM